MTPSSSDAQPEPEQKARDAIDAQLRAAGWAVQDKNAINFNEGEGQAVREYTTDCGPADYVLFIGRKPVGVTEAKRETLGQLQGNVPGSEELHSHHTILRLPTGIFYTQGVKANVLFFDNRSASKSAATKEVWYYDYRTNIHHTLKRSPLRVEDLREFITCHNPANRHKRKPTWHLEKNPGGRWRKFTCDELVSRDKTSLDLFWLKDDSRADLDNLAEPADLAEEIIENIEAGLNNFRAVAAALQPGAGGT